ncbi:MAG: serine hydrolase domain-containing protein, partial [Nannocystaceae bacterium]
MPHFRPHHPSARRPWPALALLLATVACAGKAPAETAAPVEAKPAAPTTSAADDELQARLDWLAERLEKARVDNHIPGMAVAVVKDDQMVFARGFGLADLETGREVTPQTVFAIGSSTKAFSATLAAMQVDAGKLSWDDTVVTHLPEMKLQPRPGKAEGGDADPTLRDMGSHRSGFTRMSMLWIANALPRDQMLAKASGAEPIAGFRDEFHYNNVTYTAVGEAAARTADTTWSAMLQERIFEPLGMGDTTATAAGAIDDPARAQGYRWREVSERHEALPMRNLDAIGPAGSINSTVVDMSQWLRLQLGRGTFEGKELVSKGAIEETWTPQMEMGGGLSYGLGWMLGSWQGHRVVEHGGNIDGYATEVGMLPDDGIGFVLLTNISATPLQRGSLELVFDSLLGELPGKADAKDGAAALDLAPYSGRYVANFGPFDDMRFTVTAESGTLHLDVPGQQKYELAHPDADGRWAFALTDAIKVYFDLDEQGKRANVLHMLQGGLDFELPREGYSFPPEVDAAEVADLLG